LGSQRKKKKNDFQRKRLYRGPEKEGNWKGGDYLSGGGSDSPSLQEKRKKGMTIDLMRLKTGEGEQATAESLERNHMEKIASQRSGVAGRKLKSYQC